ncbi:UDP-glycosyltransferase 71b5 [Phtheirospermum japonicum]|uniref:UDP-glycosyltransferase 71b5 n=1 Tax=Phtheirospermum japonicum TaxID=374723 RepID=A0A830C3R5_9LAMI|nr:UDP-glycosyltransferase 71b5 [Phtheirospermum japonicum]
MGHLLPFLRLAAMLASRNCTITLITVHPTVSAAEAHHLSTFLTTHPNIKHLQFQLIPYKKSKFTNEDPFFIQLESINNSIHLLGPLLSSLSPPLSAIIADFPVTTSVADLASKLLIPTYVVITTSARFFNLMTHLPHLKQDNNTNSYIEIPSLGPMAVSNIPPPMLNQNHFFAANICSNISSLSKVKAILINTFGWFEPEAIEALTSRNGLSQKILPIGPFESFETAPEAHNLRWLDEQAHESVLFVSFGSRTALTVDQIRELANGLEKSGCKFLWVLKLSKVDRDDSEGVEEVTKDDKDQELSGDQEKILAHPAVGGFVNQCEWDSVMEAALHGVPILAWPQHGDQKMNAKIAEKVGLGIWMKEWGGKKLVDGKEIGRQVARIMGDLNIKKNAKIVRDKAREACEISGSSEKGFMKVIKMFT